MLKMSSLLSIIGLQELTPKANELTVTVYRPLEIYTVLVLEYLILYPDCFMDNTQVGVSAGRQSSDSTPLVTGRWPVYCS